MSFIQKVKTRVHNANEFAKFKNLVTAYSLCIKHDIIIPKLYFILSQEEATATSYEDLYHRLPNLFTIRPSIFLNNKYDYMLRDDGLTLHNFATGQDDQPQNIYKTQCDAMQSIDNSSLLFEEFPLVNHVLQYPTHYRLHTFYGGVALIQIVKVDGKMGWCNNQGKILATTNDNTSLQSHDIPQHKAMESLVNAGRKLSLATKQPYIRIDFVLSTHGPMFRSFACIPGDVRSQTFATFYQQIDEQLDNEWIAAEERIKNADNPTTKPTISTDTPDDNA